MTVDHAAIWQPSPNMWTGRAGYKPRWIILHGTAGGGAVEWLTNPVSQVSAHYVIKQDGSIYQLVDEDDSAWANGVLSAGHDAWWDEAINPNLLTISIEHEKPDDQNATPLTAAQQAASEPLIGRICARWNIPTRAADASGGITGHFSIDPVDKKNCPGVYPWDAMYSYIQQTHGEAPIMLQIGSGMGAYFVDKGGNPDRWHCTKTNVDLIGENLNFYRKYEGIGGLPLTNEIYLSQYPGTAIVACERWVQCYDPNYKIDSVPGSYPVYLLHLDKGIGQQLIAKPLIQNLNKTIIDLTNQRNALQAEHDALKAQSTGADVTALQSQIDALNTKCANYEKALKLVSSTVQPYI